MNSSQCGISKDIQNILVEQNKQLIVTLQWLLEMLVCQSGSSTGKRLTVQKKIHRHNWLPI